MSMLAAGRAFERNRHRLQVTRGMGCVCKGASAPRENVRACVGTVLGTSSYTSCVVRCVSAHVCLHEHTI